MLLQEPWLVQVIIKLSTKVTGSYSRRIRYYNLTGNVIAKGLDDIEYQVTIVPNRNKYESKLIYIYMGVVYFGKQNKRKTTNAIINLTINYKVQIVNCKSIPLLLYIGYRTSHYHDHHPSAVTTLNSADMNIETLKYVS